MEAPNNQEWGPSLWMILHSAAERIGTKILKRLPHEEDRIWSHLLTSLRYSIPCPACKKHYSDYLAQHPFETTRDGMRQWLFHFHHAVNTRLHKPNEWTVERVREHYEQPFHFTKHESVILHHMMRALRRGWITRTDMGKTARLLEEMRRFYDFF